MTVAALPSTASYLEDGTTVSFPVPFRFKAATDLVVDRVIGGIAFPLTLGADYAVAGGASDAGGTITRLVASSGAVLRIRRRTARSQPMVYTANDRFPAKSHEEALDRGILIDQEQDAGIGDLFTRAPLVPLGEMAPTLPLRSAIAGKGLAGDADGNIVPFVIGDANDPGLRNDLAAAGGAALVGGSPGWTIAPARSQASKNSDTASAFDVISAAQHPAILARSSTYEVTADLRKAITDAAAQRRQLLLPPGLYNVRPDTIMASEAGDCRNALPIPSYMDIAGPGATLRVVDGVSTDVTPRLMSLFGTTGTPHDVAIRDLVLDMNGAGNPISPGRDGHVYNRFPQAAIYVSGTPGGVAARIDDALIQRVTMRNSPGVSCIVMAQSNSPGIQLGRGWKLLDCRFLENGYDTDDHSSVFGWADDVETRACRFENSVQLGDHGRGGLVAYEVHGSFHRFLNNLVRRYFQGMWIGENKTGDVHDTLIQGNTFDEMKAIGIATFGIDPGYGSYDHLIAGNIVNFDALLHPGYPLKQGVSVTSLYPRRQITVDGLRVTSPAGSPVASTAIAVDAPTQPGLHDQLVFRNVRAEGTTFRHYLRTNALRGLGTITLDGGEGINLTPAGAFTVAADISVASTGAQIDHLIVDRPVAIDFRIPAQCSYAGYYEGKIGRFTLKPGDYRGMTQDGHVENVTDITERAGTFSKLVTIGDPPSIAAKASWATTLAVPAADFFDVIAIGFNVGLGGLTSHIEAASAGFVNLILTNPTAAAIDPPPLQGLVTVSKAA